MTAGPRLRVLVVDDEPPAREILRCLLDADPEVEVAGECADGQEAVAAVRRLRPDVVFLDVQMPGLDGLGVVEALAPDELPLVVFVTAYDAYAVKAFEVHALDYLLKPFDDERFGEALARVKDTLRRRQVDAATRRLVALLDGRGAPAGAAEATDADGPPQRLLVRSGGRVVYLKPEEIDWIEAADYYVRLHAGGRRHLLRESLAALEERLDARRFARVHRSAIVNLERVRELHPGVGGGAVLVLEDGTRLPVSRRLRRRFEELLAE